MSSSSCDLQCVTFDTVPQCTGDNSQGYTLTWFPNVFAASLEEAEANAAYIESAVSLVTCYDNIRELLCGTAFPECRPGEGLVYPPRTMCHDFETKCAALLPGLASFGVEIDCTLYPEDQVPICPSMPTTSKTTNPVEKQLMETKAATTEAAGNKTKLTQLFHTRGLNINLEQNVDAIKNIAKHVITNESGA